jgi:predicted GNAT family acetyltransferase
MADRVVDNAARQRYELQLDGGVAFIDYTAAAAGTVRTLTHAEVPVSMRGGGIAGRLTGGALELARSQGLQVVPRCPYVATYIEKHPEYHDLVAKR